MPIVGSGNNGAVLHYIANDAQLLNGELLLIDAGGEYWGYGSDITRTYPVNGVFTAAQTLMYEPARAFILLSIAQIQNSTPNPS